MLAEFKVINDALRPSISTNLCSVCCRNEKNKQKIGCCSYEPEFCLFDLVFLYLEYPAVYELLLREGRIIKGFNGIMVEMKSGLNRCPFIGELGCSLPKDATPPLCRLYICRQAAVFGPPLLEERFDDYFTSNEYRLNDFLNSKLNPDADLDSRQLHGFIVKNSGTIQAMLMEIDRTASDIESFSQEINLKEFG